MHFAPVQFFDSRGVRIPRVRSRSSCTETLALLLCLVVPPATMMPLHSHAEPPPSEVRFFGETSSPISSAVAIPAGRACYFTSGTVPPVLDDKAAPGSRERFGDTKTQAAGCLKRIEALLQERGLGLRDVVYLRVYLTADKAKDNQCDFKGWFEAYGQCFGTTENPHKPARSTLGVASLVNPEWLIEIEAVAVYPEK
jgi:enamine deaminase RidA (YjgF/YER057c/UK114 family)